MSDLINVQNRISLAKAGELVGVAASTVFRWTQGTHGVRLAHARLGRRMYTSEQALTQFMNELAAAREAKADTI
ncbi:MAG: DUF1580 domain-containing protein [Planctomycetota bacterium]